jgi:hypothetical protein
VSKVSAFRKAFMRLRRIGRKVEDELYDWADEEGGKEGPTRATLLTGFQGFLTLWKASEAGVVERVLGLAGFAGLAWFLTGDLVFGVKHRLLRLAAGFFAALWFIPGLIAAAATILWGLGPENLKHWRTYPIMVAFASGGLIAFRAVFGELAEHQARALRGGRRAERP